MEKIKDFKLYDNEIYDNQINSGISNFLSNQKSKEEALREEVYQMSMKNAQVGSASVFADMIYVNDNVKNNARSEYSFREDFTRRILTNIMTEIIDESLLVEKTQYLALNPEYKNEIKTRVNSMLESSKINLNINNSKTKSILEAINAEMPVNHHAYKLMEETDICDVSNKIMSNGAVSAAIKDLTTDVRERVADIVTRDNVSSADEQKFGDDLTQAVNAVNNSLATETLPQTPAPETNLSGTNGEVVPEADGQQTEQEQPAEISVDENPVVEESYARGIIETITLNEAQIMLKNTGTYNNDLAMANALKFVTVLEAFDATDLMNVNSQVYKKIINSSRASIHKQIMEETKNTFTGTKFQEVKPVNENALPTGKRSFADWKKEKDSIREQENKVSVLAESLVNEKIDASMYIDRNGYKYSRKEVESLLESYGYDFKHDNFEDAILVNNIIKA